jgi:hypothetical protein
MKTHALAILAIVATFIQGCSLLQDPCGAVMPTVVASQSRLADVQRALSEVERSGVRDLLKSPEAKEQFDTAMLRAWKAYELAVQALSVASESCSQPSISGLLTEIVDAWSVVRSFLSLFGGTGTPTVTDPIVWTEAQ